MPMLRFHLPVLGYDRGAVVSSDRLDHVAGDHLNALINDGAITVEPSDDIVPADQAIAELRAVSEAPEPTDGV